MIRPSVLIVTGQSGSGKSTAIRALEDQGYFCVDNMPPGLVEQLIATVASHGERDRIALVMDVREPSFLEQAPGLIAKLRANACAVHVLYLEAQEAALIRRYSETRRRHPLDRGAGLRAALHEERELLASMRELADDTLDTTAMTPHALREAVARRYDGDLNAPGGQLRVGLVSFGFKRGLPLESDIVLDVRFLPNPYFVAELRDRTGLDEAVRAFVLKAPQTEQFVDQATGLLGFLIPHYEHEGKRYLTVAIGCTGGQHRSVALVCELGRRLGARGIAVDLSHRDVDVKEARA